jgi:hypothetical protein
MFDPMIERANPKGKRASFLFGGIGDSRHMLRTIIEIAKHEGASKKLYHFTVNDINNYAITRDLIIWMLIRDLSETTEDSDEAALIANTLVFVYFGTMIPGRAFERLHQTIDEAFSALKAGKQPLKWAHLYKKDVPAYLRVLKMWKGRALKIYTNSEVIDRVTEDMKTRRGADPDFVYQVPLACKKEKLLYIHAAVFYPSPRFLELFDPEMQVLLEKFSGKPKANAERFKDHLRKHWRVNTTLISPDWWDELDNKAEYDFSHDPFEAIDSFKRPSMETFLLSLLDQSTETPTETSFYEFLAPFFANVADAIKVLQGRIQVEVLHDEFVDICEEIRFGVYPKEHGRRTKAADVELRPKNFPVTFDRIHMSNVP